MKLTSSTLLQASIIFAASVCLGLAYNSASPLAVRSTMQMESHDDSLGSTAAAPASMPDPTLRNETTSASIITQAAGAGQPSADKNLPATLAWPQVKPLLAQGQITLVDARESVAFEAGHIPGAVSLPLSQLKDKIGEFTAKYSKTTPLVVYCSNIHCGMAHAAAVMLAEQQGYADVREMPGGYAEWMVAESGAGKPAGGQ